MQAGVDCGSDLCQRGLGRERGDEGMEETGHSPEDGRKAGVSADVRPVEVAN